MSERLPTPEGGSKSAKEWLRDAKNTVDEQIFRAEFALYWHIEKARKLARNIKFDVVLVAAALAAGNIQGPSQEQQSPPPTNKDKVEDVMSVAPVVGPLDRFLSSSDADGLPNPFAQHKDFLSAFTGQEKVLPESTQTSTVLAGRQAVNVVFLECSGASCTQPKWDSDSIASVLTQVDSMADLVELTVNRDRPTANLDINRIPITDRNILRVPGEPIDTASSSHIDLINQGVPEIASGVNGFDRVLNLNRQALANANGSTTIIVVNAENDADKRFPDSRANYAYIQGPHAVFIYEGKGSNTNFQKQRLMHEYGHLYGALDQYAAANIPCDRRSGYFGAENQNSELGCASNVLSIMRATTQPVIDEYAYAQMGLVPHGMDLLVAGQTTVTDLGKTGNTYRFQVTRSTPQPANGFAPSSLNGIQMAAIRQGGRTYQGVPEDGQWGGTTEVVRVTVPEDNGAGSFVSRAAVGLDHVHVIGPEAPTEKKVYIPLVQK